MPKPAKTDDHTRRAGADDKGPAWYTAFFNLAEVFRQATNGALNHKMLYARLSLEGRYLNHQNPAIRKRTAGTLSRIVHSKSYLLSMREAFLADDSVFDRSARHMCSALRDAQGFDDGETIAWLIDTCWPSVRTGLANEAGEWRRDLDLPRLDYEMSMLLEPYRAFSAEPNHEACEAALTQDSTVPESATARPDATLLLSTMLYAMAFGHLRVEQARNLVDAQTSGEFPRTPGQSPVPEASRVCLIRFSDPARAVVSGFWTVEDEKPFTIGRYTDCSAIEFSPEVSRIHCLVRRESGRWLLEDAGSRNGCEVHRGETRAFPLGSACGNGEGTSIFPLEFGDVIALPGGSAYLFASLDEPAPYPFSPSSYRASFPNLAQR